MKKGIFIALVFGVFLYLRVNNLEKKSEPNTCFRATMCLKVYISENCSECDQVKPFINTWIENTRDSENAVELIQDKTMTNLPQYILYSREGKELIRGQRAFDWATKELMTAEDLQRISSGIN